MTLVIDELKPGVEFVQPFRIQKSISVEIGRAHV
jgi:hypothetical protein